MFLLRLSVAFVLLAWLLWLLFLSNASHALETSYQTRSRPGKIPQAGGEETFLNDQKDAKHCKYPCVLLFEASKVRQNHAICVVFCAFTPGNHVNTGGFELSSAQNHGIYTVFSKSMMFSAFRAPRLRSFCNAATCIFLDRNL